MVAPFKGKIGNRGWATLPPDVIRLIMSHIIREASQWALPTSWLGEIFWPNRMAYTALRTTTRVEVLMAICQSWRKSLNSHYFWTHLCSVLDPAGQVSSWRVSQTAVGGSAVWCPKPDYFHYKIVRTFVCIPCRVNAPHNPREGIVQPKRVVPSYACGHVNACRDHKADTFCGVCLRIDNSREDYLIFKNDDNETFCDIRATCMRCRQDAIHRRANHDHYLRNICEAMRHDRFSVDWEVRQVMDQFVEVGEGTISKIICLAWEKLWLRQHTKILELLDQAVAAARFQNREDGYDSEDELSDDDDVLSAQEEAVREMAIRDYCRGRIADGLWSLPYDQYVATTNRFIHPYIPAFHPVPYSASVQPGEPHPSQRTMAGLAPPTSELAQQVSYTFQTEMAKMLGPALQNLVRKIVIECAREGTDPSICASRMNVEDVMLGLRDEGVWWNDFDWVGRIEEREKKRRLEAAASNGMRDEEEDATSSSSHNSHDSHSTSPVLSTSTLQTSPSPPPTESQNKEKGIIPSVLLPPARSPQLVRMIPFIPESSIEMPPHTQEMLKTLWREASAPLFHCKCSVCNRAMIKEKNAAAAAVLANQAESMETEMMDAVLPQDRPIHIVPSQGITSVYFGSAKELSKGDQDFDSTKSEEDEEFDDDAAMEYGVDDRNETPTVLVRLGRHSLAPSPPPIAVRKSARKRASEEMEDEDVQLSHDSDSSYRGTNPSLTPNAKKPRMGSAELGSENPPPSSDPSSKSPTNSNTWTDPDHEIELTSVPQEEEDPDLIIPDDELVTSLYDTS
ncbi:hypothetical protein SISSUDRAFT_1059022 [Sistotremastrum suecicum HHB10207 ss-3]|uniref:Uncharacterized protein n=1 Tax=Sistotremastrum suecicum HHB10207 ss-3 TaxID=1314776 RepID=A0A166GQI5_9AGAM|nr:hypothetical protein SISSUDRAFT_1059022 [Sistotremastrum suecicum HHB10207 ss-3]